jgi:hypothetical protein
MKLPLLDLSTWIALQVNADDSLPQSLQLGPTVNNLIAKFSDATDITPSNRSGTNR